MLVSFDLYSDEVEILNATKILICNVEKYFLSPKNTGKMEDEY